MSEPYVPLKRQKGRPEAFADLACLAPSALETDRSWAGSVSAGVWRFPAWAAVVVGLVAPWIAVRGGAFAAHSLAAASTWAAPQGLADLIAARAVLWGYTLAPLAALAIASARLLERRGPRGGAAPVWAQAAGGAAVGAAAIVATLFVTALMTKVEIRPGAIAWTGAFAAMALIIVQAGAEEVFFRGWLQPILCARWGSGAGVAVCAVLFGLAHGAMGFSPLALINDSAAGLLFGLLALRSGGLSAPISAHVTWNFVEANLVGAYPNPGVDALGTFVDLDFSGSLIWTGGGQALNGALGTTAALGLAIAAVVLLPRSAAQRSV